MGSSEKITTAAGKEVSEGELVRSLMKQIKEGADRNAVLMGVPEELRSKIEHELDRQEAAQSDKKPSSELIPAEYQGLTSRMLMDTWAVDTNSAEGEIENNRKIQALEALRREEAE